MKESSSQQQSSLGPTLAGMGLFLATAAVSQWIQLHHKTKQEEQRRQEQMNYRSAQRNRQRYRRRRRIGSKSDEDWYSYNNTSADEVETDYLSKEAFRRRRLARRMSFEQLDETSSTPQKQQMQQQQLQQTQGHRSTPQSPVTEWSRHQAMSDLVSPQGRFSHESTTLPTQQQLNQQKHLPVDALNRRKLGRSTHGESKSSPLRQTKQPAHNNIAPLNNRYHDFHPKYQNWRHFEHLNEDDRAKQKRRVQQLRNQQQQLLQLQRSSSQQDAGEVASQNEKGVQTNPKQSAITHNADDDDNSLSTFDNERESDDANENDDDDDDDESSSVGSFGSNQFVWTDGPKSKRHSQKSTSQNSLPKQLSKESINKLAIRSGATGTKDVMEAEHSSNSNKNSPSNSASNIDLRMGKFERFYRMLTSSIIDDDSEHIGDGATGDGNNKISVSSSSTNYGGSSTSFDYDGDIEDRHRALRTEYNAQIMPEKLVLIRHGQSMGNVDQRYYATHPDNAIPLTDLGWEQARKAGTILKDKIITPGESVHFMVSPYVRTVETFHGIVSAWCDPESEEFASIEDRNQKVNAWYERLTELGLTWNEDSRIREQDFGNYQNPEQMRRAKEERFHFGAFYYRFHNGESGSDVYDRVSTFLDSLWRSFETNKSQNYVLVTHGIVLRVLMARYFRYTITQLNTLANPRNCEMVVLGHEGNGQLDLEGRCSLELEEDPETKRKVVKGYKFHKRLRILPKSNIRTVRFRISPMDEGKVLK